MTNQTSDRLTQAALVIAILGVAILVGHAPAQAFLPGRVPVGWPPSVSQRTPMTVGSPVWIMANPDHGLVRRR
jgi:hypothetical protein